MSCRSITLLTYFFFFIADLLGQSNAQISQLELEKKQYADEVYSAALAKNDSNLLAEAYYLYAKLDLPTDPVKASEWYFKSLRILEKQGASFELGRLYYHLGLLQSTNLEKDEYIAKARAVFWECKSERGRKQFSGISKRDTVLFFDSEQLLLTNKTHSHEILRSVDNLISQKKFARAHESLKRIYFLTEGEIEDIAIYHRSKMTECHLLIEEGKPQRALMLYEEISSKYAHLINGYHGRESFHYQIGIEVYKANQLWEKALESLELLNQVNDKFYERSRVGAINRLELEFETEKKELQLEEQRNRLDLVERNLQLQRRNIVILGAGFFLMAVLSYYLFRLSSKNKKISSKNELLVAEQNHRVKNNLQFISSMLNIQKSRAGNTGMEDDLNEIQLRIESMAILQKRLYSNDRIGQCRLSTYFEEIIENVLVSCSKEEVDFEFSGDDPLLRQDEALSLGIIITELGINSCKHAFKDEGHEQIKIECRSTGQEIIIKYKDGGHLKNSHLNSKTNGSFGFEMITSQLEQLRGEIITEPNSLLSFAIPKNS